MRENTLDIISIKYQCDNKVHVEGFRDLGVLKVESNPGEGFNGIVYSKVRLNVW